MRQFLQENGLTERHARALLRLGTEEQQLAAAQVFCRRRMNVAAAEAYIEDLLHRQQVTPPKGRTTYIIKDVRLFLNSVDRGLAPDASGGSQRRLGPSGYRRGDPSDHPYSQAGADIMRRSV